MYVCVYIYIYTYIGRSCLFDTGVCERYSLWKWGVTCLFKDVSHEMPDTTSCRTSPPIPFFRARLARNAWCNTVSHLTAAGCTGVCDKWRLAVSFANCLWESGWIFWRSKTSDWRAKLQIEGLKSQNHCSSKCPLKVRISQGLGPSLQIELELLKTGRVCFLLNKKWLTGGRCFDSSVAKDRLSDATPSLWRD